VLAITILVSARASQAQASIYGMGTTDFLNNGPYTDFLYGGTAGVLVDVGTGWHDRLTLSMDLQGNFVSSNTHPTSAGAGFSQGETYDAITIGPRLSFAPSLFKLAPYVQGNFGFARYHDPLNHSSTDNVFGVQGGFTRRLTPRFDALLDYSYARFGYNSGYYTPQTFSIGAVYHFAKR
jgi:hypothetical protein